MEALKRIKRCDGQSPRRVLSHDNFRIVRDVF